MSGVVLAAAEPVTHCHSVTLPLSSLCQYTFTLLHTPSLPTLSHSPYTTAVSACVQAGCVCCWWREALCCCCGTTTAELGRTHTRRQEGSGRCVGAVVMGAEGGWSCGGGESKGSLLQLKKQLPAARGRGRSAEGCRLINCYRRTLTHSFTLSLHDPTLSHTLSHSSHTTGVDLIKQQI